MTQNMTIERYEHLASAVGSMVKLTTGVANNCAISIMLDAHDQVKRHPAYRHRVKQLYRAALQAWHDYERALLHAEYNRFFHVADMSEGIRKKYGDITDRDYFEFWRGLGALAYQRSRPLVTSLHNKFRLSLVNHNVDNADTLAWAETGSACLMLAVSVCDEAIRKAHTDTGLTRPIAHILFRQFSLEKVLRAWKRAVQATDPSVIFDLDEVEQRNIEHGVLQLADLWANPDLMYDAAMQLLPDYEDIFRTKGEMKKAMREIAEVKSKAWEELER